MREILLKRNNLGVQFMEGLSNCLRYDRFIKCIDVSYNLANEESIKHLIKFSLQENNTLVSLSLVGNPGLTEKARKQIALCLLKNIDQFKSNGVEVKEEWIRPENLTFKIPQRILDHLGIPKPQN